MDWQLDRGHPLRRLFGGLVEQVFMVDMGMCDPSLTDYVTDVLVDFVHVDQIYRMRTVDGRIIREISRIEADACLGPGVDDSSRTRLVNKYIGDFTLFWAGVYPESLRRPRSGVDRLREYVLQGRRSYSIASELSDELAKPPAALLRHLAARFEFCVHGLQRVREGWQQLSSAAGEN